MASGLPSGCLRRDSARGTAPVSFHPSHLKSTTPHLQSTCTPNNVVHWALTHTTWSSLIPYKSNSNFHSTLAPSPHSLKCTFVPAKSQPPGSLSTDPQANQKVLGMNTLLWSGQRTRGSLLPASRGQKDTADWPVSLRSLSHHLPILHLWDPGLRTQYTPKLLPSPRP